MINSEITQKHDRFTARHHFFKFRLEKNMYLISNISSLWFFFFITLEKTFPHAYALTLQV